MYYFLASPVTAGNTHLLLILWYGSQVRWVYRCNLHMEERALRGRTGRACFHSEEVRSTRCRVAPTRANPLNWRRTPPHESCWERCDRRHRQRLADEAITRSFTFKRTNRCMHPAFTPKPRDDRPVTFMPSAAPLCAAACGKDFNFGSIGYKRSSDPRNDR